MEIPTNFICSICLNSKEKKEENDDETIVYTPCKHLFHRLCIQNWAKVNSKCPDCRHDLG